MTANENGGPRNGEPTNDELATGFSRRGYVRGLLGAAAAGTVLSWAPPASAESMSTRIDRYREEFGTVIDVVEAGADPNGNESVVDIIRRYADDDTLLLFPPGRYYVDEQVRFTGFENFGLVGNGATLVPANYHEFEGPTYRMFRLGVHYSPGNRLVFDNFTVDQTAADTGIRVIDAMVHDGLEVRDVTIEGKHDSGTWGPGRVNVVDPDGTGLVERFEAPDGAAWESETPNAGNIWRGPTGIIANMTEGELTFRDCDLGPFPDNGLYATGGGGRILVEGGRYENSHGSNLRLGGSESQVTGATVVVDETPSHFGAQRGVRFEKGDGFRFEDTDVTLTAANGGCSPVLLPNSCGDIWIENVSITVDTPVANTGVRVSPNVGHFTLYDSEIEHNGPGGYSLLLHGDEGGPGGTVQSVAFTGDVGDEGARCTIRNVRDDVKFRVNVIDQPGGENRYGLANLGDDCMLYKGVYRATHYPVLDSGTGTWVEDIYANSYGDKGAYCLHDDSENVYLKLNTLRGGYDDYGCAGLKTVGNEF